MLTASRRTAMTIRMRANGRRKRSTNQPPGRRSISYSAVDGSRPGAHHRAVTLTSWLYRLARLSADARAVASGDAKKIGRRAKNKLGGRSMGRAGVWRRLWK
jgi:hypothetical protein